MADFEAALAEVKPAFGAVVDTLETYRLNGMIDSGDTYRHLRSTCQTLVQQVRMLPVSSQDLYSKNMHMSCVLLNCLVVLFSNLVCSVSEVARDPGVQGPRKVQVVGMGRKVTGWGARCSGIVNP
jgi:hypothetical protein